MRETRSRCRTGRRALIALAGLVALSNCGPPDPQPHAGDTVASSAEEGRAPSRVDPGTPKSTQPASVPGSEALADGEGATRVLGAPWWEDSAYPDLGPFAASRMTAILLETGDDLAAATKEIRELSSSIGIGALSAKEETDRLLAGEGLEGLDPEDAEELRRLVALRRARKGPSARIEPALTLAERKRWTSFGMALGMARPLWSVREWGEPEVELGAAFAEVLGSLPGAPSISFSVGDAKANADALARASRFVRTKVGEDRVIAAMIFTMDAGPYVGLPVPEGAGLVVVDSVSLDDELVFDLCRREGDDVAEPFVARCRRGEKPVFERVLSQAPDGDLVHVEFSGGAPTRLGSYGWKIHLMTRGPGGTEYAHLYLAGNGALRFYFVSW